jgi:predicted short-subunit dehydrogenase-like oxidoreductase (DUF2520 family)
MAASVAILGSGNMAFQLLTAFDKADVKLAGLISRHLTQGAETLERTKARCELVGGRNLTELEAEVIILAVPDDSIEEVLKFYQFHPDHIVVHTSGAEPMSSVTHGRSGVFYPLQTFTWGEPVDFKNVPILVEAMSDDVENVLNELARSISSNVRVMSSAARLKVHLAAVLASNFTNHMYHRAEKWLNEQELPFDILYPLIEETWAKAKRLGTAKAQTGPAVRNDQRTMDRHEKLITDPNVKELYRLLSQDIQRLS